MNVTKAIMEFFIALCDYHNKCLCPLMPWTMADAVNLAVDKLADKKLSAIGKGLLTNLCTVCYPHAVITAISQRIESVRSPVAHEESQHWFKSFCNEFGAAALGNGIKEIVPWLLKVYTFRSLCASTALSSFSPNSSSMFSTTPYYQETSNSNIKVKKAALASIGTIHGQLGPIFNAILMSQCDDKLRDQIEKTTESHPFDPSSTSAEWPRVSIANKSSRGSNSDDAEDDDENDMGMSLDIPRMDLFSSISGDCVVKMVSVT